MKKKKTIRNASLVGLSAVMLCGAALGATACGGKSGTINDANPNQLTVSIFCNASDAATNQQICDTWAAEYGAKIGKNITVKLDYNIDKGDYYDRLSEVWKNPSASSVPDVIYLAPRFVKAYAEKGRIVDLTEYIQDLDAQDTAAGNTATGIANINRLWPNSVNYYGYIKGQKNTYTMGQAIAYNPNGAEGAGFYTVNGNSKVGLYALPKDYSNFSTGYNRKFFTEELKTAYTTTLAYSARVPGYDTATVKGPQSETGSATPDRRYSKATGAGYTDTVSGKSAKSCVVYAVGGTYTNPYTNQTMTAVAGEPAPIINVGVPTTYYPFNFFRFDSFADAMAGGDPMANMCWQYTNGEGYTVTLPGFPDETFKITDPDYQNTSASYDYTMGHITYTYAEYSALIWAATYYLNTFAWDDPNGETAGIRATVGTTTGFYTVFGGEQYEGSDGSPLYLLPWLYSNDADLIDVTSRYCTQCKTGTTTVSEDASTINIANPADWKTYAGANADTVSRNTISGGTIDRQVQYGFNSQNFIETYGAFLALSSDWNGNPMGDIASTDRNTNGWGYFRAGRSLFYGAGSWDAATRNDIDTNYLQFGQMPSPIAEKYALYSNVKGANYEMVTYSNDPADKESATSFGDKQRDNLSAGKTIYSQADIAANQCKRQDKWAARMDSVGYAVTDKEALLKAQYSEASEWKRLASASLCLALTAQDAAQVTLTYGGAQLPNLVDQCEEFFNYQDPANANGAFKDMITPEGFSTTRYYNEDGTVNASEAAKATQIWNAYYDLARAMSNTVKAGQAGTQTIGEFIANYQSTTWQTLDTSVVGSTIKYDEQYANTSLSKIRPASDTNGLSYAMKVLRMVYFNRSDRDINIRMQAGLNAVRDSSMYTYTSEWLGQLDARTASGLSTMLAYNAQATNSAYKDGGMLSLVCANPATYSAGRMTPAVFCFRVAASAHAKLLEAIQSEATAMN